MKSFKEYRAEKKAKEAYVQPYETMETSFGQHSEKKEYVQPYDSMETSFGQHSQEKPKINESDEFTFGLSEKFKEKERTPEEHEKVHNEHAPSSDKLEPHEIKAIHKYSDDSKKINSMHHLNDKDQDISSPKYDQLKEQTRYLDSALDKHSTAEDTHVYTGIKYSPAKHFRKVNGRVPDSVITHLPAYTSTSTSARTAEGFAVTAFHPRDSNHGIDEVEGGRHVLKIHMPKGTKAGSIKKHAWLPDENEVLLHRGHDIEIDKTPTKIGKKSYLWHAKIVGHNPNPI